MVGGEVLGVGRVSHAVDLVALWMGGHEAHRKSWYLIHFESV
jgi:hypothetical protein